MVSKLTTEYGIDSNRVYIAGWSNGAMLTLRAICELKGMFKAAIPYAGGLMMKKQNDANSEGTLFYDQEGFKIWTFKSGVTELDWFKFDSWFTCANGGDVPLLMINGLDDYVVPVIGGKRATAVET